MTVRLGLDGSGKYSVRTGIRFLDHMLELGARHGVFDLVVDARGDLDVDQHHTVEDLGIALDEAVSAALADRRGINRAGYFVMPMDETLAVAAVDLGGRPHAVVGLPAFWICIAVVYFCDDSAGGLSYLFEKAGITVKYSLRSSFSRWVLALFFAVLTLTILGRTVAVTGAIAYCGGFLFCVPTHPLGWLKIAHILSVGLASLLMIIVFRKAWREQRGHLVILPLTTILAVMFFGQALVGAMQVAQSYPPHLVFLHQVTTLALWVSLLLLTYNSGLLAAEPAQTQPLDGRQRRKDLLAVTKPLIVGLLLITTWGLVLPATPR